jgi:hypothetical protein
MGHSPKQQVLLTQLGDLNAQEKSLRALDVKPSDTAGTATREQLLKQIESRKKGLAEEYEAQERVDTQTHHVAQARHTASRDAAAANGASSSHEDLKKHIIQQYGNPPKGAPQSVVDEYFKSRAARDAAEKRAETSASAMHRAEDAERKLKSAQKKTEQRVAKFRQQEIGDPCIKCSVDKLAAKARAEQEALERVFVRLPSPTAPDKKAEFKKILSKSPTLVRQLDDLLNNRDPRKRWEIRRKAPEKKGSDCNPAARIIEIDSKTQDPAKLMQTLSHEVGHAQNTIPSDSSSRDAFVAGELANEGAATMNNIKIQREVIKNTEPNRVDIEIAGRIGANSNSPKYNEAYDQFLRDGDEAKARARIGNIFAEGEKPSNSPARNYKEYYGNSYSNNYNDDGTRKPSTRR